MIRFLTAGESHGKALTAIIDGIPSNLPITKEYIDSQLKRRQAGYGRGQRMKIESDEVEILSGVRDGKTLGSPISLLIRNRDWENWQGQMDSESIDEDTEVVTIPRPGHADLTGSIKYNYTDIRNSIERSSARETAVRTAAGTVCRRLLDEFGISVGSYVESIGNIYPRNSFLNSLYKNDIPEEFKAEELNEKSDSSEVRVLEPEQEGEIISKIKEAKKNGDTLGGTFVVVISGVPAGLGSFMQYDEKLNASLAHSIMSINAVKGVEIGGGFQLTDSFGSEVHDEIILKDNTITRRTNRAGGIEGGISTGLPIIIRGAMKPISTLMTPLNSIDFRTMQSTESRRERSDFTAVPACAVIAEAMAAYTIADFFTKKFGGDSIDEIKERYQNYNESVYSRLKQNFNREI